MTIAESLFSNLSANIKFFCDVHHDSNWKERKTKTDYTLWHIYQGQLVLDMKERSFVAKEGEVVLFYPGDAYSAHTNEDGCSFLVTFFTLETGNRMDLLENRRLAGIYGGDDIRRACENFCADYHEHFQDNLTPTMKHYASFITFLSELLEEKPKQYFHNVPVSQKQLPLHEVLDYMNSHYLEAISAKELAAKMGMSEKYFIQYFHLQTGTSPKQYLVERRMKHALVLLADADNTLSYTAARLGYSDAYAFSKAFKNYYGESPGSFRKHLV